MKRSIKNTLWGVAAILLSVCAIGGFFLKGRLREMLNLPFAKTAVFPDEGREGPADTVFLVNGIEVKMIGVRGGRINCKGLRETIELHDFYIGETEVTRELWLSVMGGNPSVHRDSLLCPVESVDLMECLDFVHKLDSVSGVAFHLPAYPEWLYAAHLGYRDMDTPHDDDSMGWYNENAGNISHPVKQKKPNALGVYDMIGNVSEWTVSGSDPLFFVVGGSFETEKENCSIDTRNLYHASIKSGSVGLRLVCYPRNAE